MTCDSNGSTQSIDLYVSTFTYSSLVNFSIFIKMGDKRHIIVIYWMTKMVQQGYEDQKITCTAIDSMHNQHITIWYDERIIKYKSYQTFYCLLL